MRCARLALALGFAAVIAPPRPDDPLVSVVVPVLDEEDCIAELARRVSAAAHTARVRLELIFVDDGSVDETPLRIAALRTHDANIKSIRLTRSFGHQSALLAGLHFAKGDAVVTMDGDLQHPPELLPRLLEVWRGGADIVHTIRRTSDRAPQDWKARTSALFYRLMNRLAGVSVPPGAADFRLLDRRVVAALNQLPEHFAFLRGLIPWLGFPDAQIEYEVAARFAGRSKYDVWRMLRLALDGILSFSVVPLRLIALLGLATTLVGIAYGIFALIAQMMGHVQTGWTSLVVLVLVFGGVQLLSVGILSEYVGRTYEEAKRRPRYVIDRLEGIEWR
ncbi:MAG TPA: glycosyltransferase family 2 protein [Myxococcota bacterium]|nr:glycosyltransferase family 2 protein [Myxococcota bacterium]